MTESHIPTDEDDEGWVRHCPDCGAELSCPEGITLADPMCVCGYTWKIDHDHD